ncbi:MAG TPA: hypothetical protein VID29_04955 [Solirubrobacteraceae bacterium]|jgi:hypothetical protein
MAIVPLKPEYGPTLGALLSPRWRRAARPLRWLAIAASVGFAAAVAALVLALLPPRYSHGGPVAFEFTYAGLYRTTPEPGGYVRMQSRRAGRLEYSFAVAPLSLPPYEGALSGELPLYAAGRIKALAARYRDFQLRGEGKTRVTTLATYSVFYTVRVQGRAMYGRDVFVLPNRTGARAGVDISLLSSPKADRQITSPLLVASQGVLFNALHSFSFR